MTPTYHLRGQAYQEAEIDFVADNPGLTLFHCHQPIAHGFRIHDGVRLRVAWRKMDVDSSRTLRFQWTVQTDSLRLQNSRNKS